ncbi:glutamine--tRNA ligase/YqeY domain fusion protein [Mesoterricola silvestris]|uniref:Glutamine--tRNA ligase n=1 Tax=Mesoterricola silvestris TaxID=2927979 RepID=A0AA48GNV7_9BACT|nr:glutamine--tRNA ligase/YqeY domain fusion protein [Mesoterricola silvestris]BDU74799.1 glutamine--tRNA ligase [Mesoterricola silvestris]
MTNETPAPEPRSLNFIEEIMEADGSSGKHQGRICTRFPPEPNGYLHIGHAKSICINFGLAAKYGGRTNLRFDDTNPVKEDIEYVDSIRDDVRWLGFDWAGEHYASDYFPFLYDYAEYLIGRGMAYVCDLNEEEIKEYRGNFFKAGRNSPYRDRSPEENLDLFRRMRAGEFPDGARTLRAKIDMQSPNMNMRDPLMYRIKRAHHHRTGDAWLIYPMYDFAHGVSDAIERITHSICTLEFEDHRPLYDWFLQQDVDGKFFSRPHPRQIEFARLNLTYTVMSKRRLLELVKEGIVKGWDDPRMPTISGLRRRGYTAASVRAFAEKVGVAKRDMVADVGLLEHCVREDLAGSAPRAMAVLRPLKVVIENMAEGEVHWLDVPNHPENEALGRRKVPFTREVYVEREDFQIEAPKKWFRLAPGAEVRLKNACLLRCTGVVQDAAGEVTELRCTWDPASLGGDAPDGRKVKGTLHWVSAAHALACEVRLYDRLFTAKDPMDVPEGEDWRHFLNPESMEVLPAARVEPSLAAARPGEAFQFERLGYFVADPDGGKGTPVFNRTVSLKDSWAKAEAK